MTHSLTPSIFATYWCDKCQLPKGDLDITFPYQCSCLDNQHPDIPANPIQPYTVQAPIIFHEPFGFIVDAGPICANTAYAPNCYVYGLSCLVLDYEVRTVIGYNFLYEFDCGLFKATTPYNLTLCTRLSKMISKSTGSCITRRSAKGWHFISLNIIPYRQFKELATSCERISHSDHRYLVLRFTKKPDEHRLVNMADLKFSKSPYSISQWHKHLWEQVLQHPIDTRQKEVLTAGMIVHYIATS